MSQYWDGDGLTGRYFAGNDLGGHGYSGFVYDVFYVFGGEAAWLDEPGPLAASGVPVISAAEDLRAALAAQL